MIKSSRVLFLIYKYFFLYLPALLVLGMVKSEINGRSVQMIQLIGILPFLTMHWLLNKYVYSAVVTDNGIQLGKVNIAWSEIKTLNRIYNLYYLITKRNKRVFVFPCDVFPDGIFHGSITEGDMDQKIEKMKTKFEIE